MAHWQGSGVGMLWYLTVMCEVLPMGSVALLEAVSSSLAREGTGPRILRVFLTFKSNEGCWTGVSS